MRLRRLAIRFRCNANWRSSNNASSCVCPSTNRQVLSVPTGIKRIELVFPNELEVAGSQTFLPLSILHVKVLKETCCVNSSDACLQDRVALQLCLGKVSIGRVSKLLKAVA